MSEDDLEPYLQKIAARSRCKVMVGAVIENKNRIISVGWNNSGTSGQGECAEINAIKKAYRRRRKKLLKGATIYVFGFWQRTKKNLRLTKPCPKCLGMIQDVGSSKIIYYDRPEFKVFTVEQIKSEICN